MEPAACSILGLSIFCCTCRAALSTIHEPKTLLSYFRAVSARECGRFQSICSDAGRSSIRPAIFGAGTGIVLAAGGTGFLRVGDATERIAGAAGLDVEDDAGCPGENAD